jgi:cell volume regulation protein A
MSDVEHFALLVLVVGAAITAAVLPNRISERIRIPTPAIFLLAAAAASDLVPALGQLSVTTVQRVVSVALMVILFDGGMHIGWRRFRSAALPVVWVRGGRHVRHRGSLGCARPRPVRSGLVVGVAAGDRAGSY